MIVRLTFCVLLLSYFLYSAMSSEADSESAEDDFDSEESDFDSVESDSESLVSDSESSPSGSEEPELEEGMSKLSFKSANLTEEEQFSSHMPSDLKCDACRIISFMLQKNFEKEHQKMKSRIEKVGRLKESDVLTIVDRVCDDSFEQVGLKAVNGVNRLSGPGLETEKVMGLMQGGGKWPGRLKSMCREFAGEIGEEQIYDAYLLNKEMMEDFMCRGPDIQGSCLMQKKEEL